jgi:hypothetical protein
VDELKTALIEPFVTLKAADDAKPSLPVGMGPARWGALADFGAWEPQSTKRIYGLGR